ncbi:MAG: class I SAM-dependent methyltransferase [Flavobacteriia bacterium]|nr:class I SAM-dependent methyltransferase [Flavobacteriia bacterium]
MNDPFLGKIYTIDDKKALFDFKGYKIPVHLIKLTGGGPESFEAIAKLHIEILNKIVGLSEGMNIIEIGCGIGRDAFELAEILGSTGHYLGIDIFKESIDWCKNNISQRHPNFDFLCFDVKSDWFNPLGKKTLREHNLPVGKDSIDLIILQSVFTHLNESDLLYYLRQFERALRCGGCVYATCFLIDEELISGKRLSPYLSFPHKLSNGVYLHDTRNPEYAVAYTKEKLHQIVSNSNLKIKQIINGSWSGRPGEALGGQDSLVLVKK